MKLSQEQVAKVKEWARQGSGLSEIQSRLEKEFGMKMTYMEARLLILEAGIEVQEKKRAASIPEKKPVQPEESLDAGDDNEEQQPDDTPDAQDDVLPQGNPDVSVSVDRVTVPGTIVSGTVTFSGGNSAKWHIDQYGRVAVSNAKPGFKPSREDLMAFQSKLRELLEKRGF